MVKLAFALRASRSALPEYEGVAGLWFDSAEPRSSEEARLGGAKLLEGERRFCDLESSPLWLSEEKPVIDGA